MDSRSLQNILLVKAVEEHDADGTVLPHAEREAATRNALRAYPAVAAGSDKARRERHTWKVLAARGQELAARLEQRHPVVTRAVALENHAGTVSLALVVLAAAAGVAMSLVDGRVRIEILAFPLAGIVLWNLAVYAAILLGLTRRGRAAGQAAASAFSVVTWPARWAWRRAAGLIRQAAFHHKPLAAALRRYSDEWWPLAQSLLYRQGKCLFHFAAAALAIGLVAGFYLRGIVFEYRAGWESTFLGPAQVRMALHVLYGPASAVSGLTLPADDASVAALHWRDGAGGGPAAPWIHLIGATALLFVILPRLALAAFAWFGLLRARRDVEVPESLHAYARSVLARSDAALPSEQVVAVPFAYRPSAAAAEGTRRLLAAAFGDAQVTLADPVDYGYEASVATRLRASTGDVAVMVFSLAATPEAENHGAALGAARDTLAQSSTRLLVLVDESPFLASMQGDASLADRITQRRESWVAFVADHGLQACLAPLATWGQQGATVSLEAIDTARRCTWSRAR
jgi:hypothetical protein